MAEKTRFNMVEMMADGDEEQAFDQPCAYENRVGGHGTYCHNEKVDARKCPWRWCSIKEHRSCDGFALNGAAYTGQWEEK